MKPQSLYLRGEQKGERKVEFGHLLQVFLIQMQDGFETWTRLDFLRISVSHFPQECIGIKCVPTHAFSMVRQPSSSMAFHDSRLSWYSAFVLSLPH